MSWIRCDDVRIRRFIWALEKMGKEHDEVVEQ